VSLVIEVLQDKLEDQVNVDQQVFLDEMEQMDDLDLMDPVGLMDNQVHVVNLDNLEMLVQLENQESRDLLAHLDQMVSQEALVPLVQVDVQVKLEHKELQVQPEGQVQMLLQKEVSKVPLESLGNLDHLGELEVMDKQELEVKLEDLVQQDHQETLVWLGCQVEMVRQAKMGDQGLLVKGEPQDVQDLKDHVELMVPLENLVQWEQLALMVRGAHKGNQVLVVHQEREVLQDRLVTRAIQDLLDLLDNLVI